MRTSRNWFWRPDGRTDLCATSIVQIPSPMQGFVNLGDCIVLLSGWILGPWWGAAAGGIGSMLVDLLAATVTMRPAR